MQNQVNTNTTKIGSNTTDITALQNRMTDAETLANSNKTRIATLESNGASVSTLADIPVYAGDSGVRLIQCNESSLTQGVQFTSDASTIISALIAANNDKYNHATPTTETELNHLAKIYLRVF